MDSSNLGRKMKEAFVQATATGATKVTTWSPVKKTEWVSLHPAHLKTLLPFICWNHAHRHGARFVLKSFFVYKYLSGVSRQLS